MHSMVNREADVLLMAEHSVHDRNINATCSDFSKDGTWERPHLSGLDPECEKSTGGVGIAVRKGLKHYIIKPKTKAGKVAVRSGRAALYGVQVGSTD